MSAQFSPWFWLIIILLLLLLFYLIEAYYRRRFPFNPGRYPRREYYIRDQVIVTGSEADVDAAILRVKNVNLKLIKRLRLQELGPRLVSCEPLPNDVNLHELVIDLYAIGGGRLSVERAIREINAALDSTSGRIIPEPNRLTGDPWEPEGSPWEPEGSPWEPEGSPWEPEGSPLQRLLGRKHKESQDAPADLFMHQWAFDNIELHYSSEKPTGDRVQVGIFDTSPFVEEDLTAMGGVPQTKWVQAQNAAPMKLKSVRNAKKRAVLRRNSRQPVNLANHGLFVAGLIYALAENCDLHLIRVLDDDNRGDLFTLLEAIFEFVKEFLGSESNPNNVVLNLSLGIRIPPEEASFDLPSSIKAIEYLLKAAHCLGAVTVAAAGNESSGLPKPNKANFPAFWSENIGVAASNITDKHACFSNNGLVHAPGGDGGGPKGCAPQAQNCQGNCAQAVVGPVIKSSNNTGFIYWTGSSFAAPMVSGLAALVIQKGDFQLSPDEVKEKILCGAQVADKNADQVNVINVRRTLEECMHSDQYRQSTVQAK